jgi:copper homeostasis protein
VTLVEACVESLAESLAAAQGGANRLELCDRLDVGGTTPSAALIDEVKRHVRIPVSVMIRPRGGSFVHTAAELDEMRRGIDMALSHGADMLVIGVLGERGDVDAVHTRELVDRAGATPVTFHRAFDEVRDQSAALETLVGAGVARVLTGGGAGRAIDHVDQLSRLVAQSAGRIAIMAGGKVRGDNARAIVEQSHVAEVHARCERDPARIREIVDVLK